MKGLNPDEEMDKTDNTSKKVQMLAMTMCCLLPV